MDEKKISLVIIIVLLVISIPASLGGIYFKYIYKAPEEPAPEVINKNLFQNGELHFFNYDTELGTYKCKNPSGKCTWAVETIDDQGYSLNFYNDGVFNNELDSVINNRFAFITDAPISEEIDTSNVILYDIIDKKVIGNYLAVKNYTIGLDNDYFIVEDNFRKWGVIKINTTDVSPVLAFEYDFIGVQNELANASNKLLADSFVVQKNSKWSIVDVSGKMLSQSFDEQIYAYHGRTLAAKNTLYGTIGLYDYEGKILTETPYKDVKFFAKYIGVLEPTGDFYLLNYNDSKVVSSKYTVGDLGEVKVGTKEDGTTDLYIKDEVVENIK